MEVKNFVMMAVTLIIGVVLVAGVLTPVIADNIGSENSGSGESGETYTNEGEDRYTIPNNNTRLSYYPCYPSSYSLEPPSVPDRGIYNNLMVFTGVDENLMVQPMTEIEGDTYFGIWIGEEAYTADRVEVIGKNLTFTDRVTHESVSTPITLCTNPNGEYVSVVFYDHDSDAMIVSTAYANTNTPITCTIVMNTGSDGGCYVGIEGTISNNSVTLIDSSEDVETVGKSAVFTITDNQITAITLKINGVDHTCEMTADQSSEAGYVESCILPVEVSERSGSGGVSQTLASFLTVIPILVIVGLVLMAVTMFRRS